MSNNCASEVLLVGQKLGANDHLRSGLAANLCAVSTAIRGHEALRQAEERSFDVIVTELVTADVSGIEFLKRIRLSKPRLPIILVDEQVDSDRAIEANKLGAFGYFASPIHILELIEAIIRAISNGRRLVSAIQIEPARYAERKLIGSSRVMNTLFVQIGHAARSPFPVLIRGATGTGKELVARAIHEHSDRSKGPFVGINCSAIPETLLESELFGHEAGAFTGASKRKAGRFEQANGGTLFLDEIGDLSPTCQAKLLRVLQERRVLPLGGSQEIRLEVRIVSATHRDLDSLRSSEAFRNDLFFRLAGLSICVPSLNEHQEDIPELAQHFLRQYGKTDSHTPILICREALECFKTQAWPGNVRQLEHAVQAAASLAHGRVIEVRHVEEACRLGRANQSQPGAFVPEQIAVLLQRALSGELKNFRAAAHEQTDRELFHLAYQKTEGNQSKMAKLLKVTRTTVRQVTRKFGLTPLTQTASSIEANKSKTGQPRLDL